jgi:uncharacterized protein YyaL (SSP411 family)
MNRIAPPISLLLVACGHVQATTAPAASDAVDRLVASYQKVHGGFDPERRYLDLELLELGLIESAAGNELVRGMVQKTLLKNIMLIDPVAGGAYDYSDVLPGRHPWRSPNGKKSLRTQAINLKLYSLAHQVFRGWRYLEAARLVYRYLARDLADRLGGFHEPGDRRISTADNGLVISALAAYHRASGDARALRMAITAAERMIGERSLARGGFFEEGEDVLSVEATLAMTEALTALHRVNRDDRWLTTARRSRSAMTERLIDGSGKFSGMAAGILTADYR